MAVFLFSCVALGAALLTPTVADATYSQCPSVYKDSGCQFLITVTENGVQVAEDSSQGPYEGADDALIGIQNNSSKSISSFPVSAEGDVFGFERDGLCDPGEKAAPGCVVLPKDSEGNETKGVNPATGSGECGPQDGACGFPPPSGEPSNLTFENGAEATGFASNGDAVSGYEGPTSWFTNISSGFGSGVIHFSPELAPGSSTYFALESPPNGKLDVGNPTTISTTLAGGGQSGAAISVVQGTPVTDTATLAGNGAASATGVATYSVYSDPACTSLAAAAGTGAVSGSTAAPSSAEAGLAPGTYYWQVTYGGDVNNQAITSTCGSEVLTVLAATTTSTVQSGGGVSGSSLTVPAGTSVTDQAHIAGTLAATATGSVSYVLYKNSKCTVALAPGSSAAVVNGAAGPSAAIRPKVGVYYWQATYSGGGLNAPSTSACGSEILVVALKANLGLPSSNVCLSRRKFVVHPRAPRNVKLVSVEIQINGKTVKRGHLSKRETTVSLVGLPKGTFKVALITKSSTGKLYEDIRTYHTCVSGHHKRK